MAEVRPVAPDISRVWLDPTDAPLFDYAPGHVVLIGVGAAEPAYFAIAEAPERAAGRIELLVRRGGTVADALLTLGTAVEVMGPLGRPWPLDLVRAGRDLLLVGGGTGIAPLRAALRSLGPTAGRVALLYGAANPVELCYRDEWTALVPPLVHAELTVDLPADGWRGATGFAHMHLASPLSHLTAPLVLLCGGRPMLTAVANELSIRNLHDRHTNF